MSAFIVSDTTMNFVVNTIQDFDGLRSSCFAPFLTDGEVDCNKLGNKLFHLNNDAVCQRYDDHDDSNVIEFFRHTSLMPASDRAEKCQRLKAVQCLIYQCSEGDVPETPLFKALDALSDWLQYNIISSLPEYNAAKWDAA